MNEISEAYNESVKRISNGIRKYIYDIVTGIVIVVILAASLHVFGLADLSDWSKWSVFLMDWFPYLAAAILLNTNLYQKGVFVGKTTESYVMAMRVYSHKVNSLTGEHLDSLHDFCDEYNEQALIRVRRELLRPVGISYEVFDTTLRTMSKKQLLEKYEKRVVNLIIHVRQLTIRGINVNLLLSNFDIKDPTDIGKTEKSLSKSHSIWSTVRYIFTTLLMSLVVINDLSTWGWSILIVVIFKVAFLIAGTLMSYFRGYNDMTVNLVAHVARKSDILKEFDTWYAIKNNLNVENTLIETVEN